MNWVRTPERGDVDAPHAYRPPTFLSTIFCGCVGLFFKLFEKSY